MKVEIHVNGSLVLELQPETDIERMVLAEMAAGADRGKKVSLSQNEQATVKVAVEL
jgi:hypothetical protein